MTSSTICRPRMAAIYAPARYASAAGTAMATCAAVAAHGIEGKLRNQNTNRLRFGLGNKVETT